VSAIAAAPIPLATPLNVDSYENNELRSNAHCTWQAHTSKYLDHIQLNELLYC